VIAEIQKRGLRVPEDISIAGFDDVVGAAGSRPALTTVRQPMLGIGEAAANLVLGIIDGDGEPGKKVYLPTELAIRDSVARLPL
jgi:DNA-binding LacI/PurR family transcriptional regulator